MGMIWESTDGKVSLFIYPVLINLKGEIQAGYKSECSAFTFSMRRKRCRSENGRTDGFRSQSRTFSSKDPIVIGECDSVNTAF